MHGTDKQASLRKLQAEIDALRSELGVSAPKSVLYFSSLAITGNKAVVVEANGLGGATLLVVEGNYPLDFVTAFEKEFTTEHKAIEEAERIALDFAPTAEILA